MSPGPDRGAATGPVQLQQRTLHHSGGVSGGRDEPHQGTLSSHQPKTRLVVPPATEAAKQSRQAATSQVVRV